MANVTALIMHMQSPAEIFLLDGLDQTTNSTLVAIALVLRYPLGPESTEHYFVSYKHEALSNEVLICSHLRKHVKTFFHVYELVYHLVL